MRADAERRDMSVTRLLYRPEDAAFALGVSRTTVYEYMASGELASVTLGKSRRVPVADLLDFVDRRRALTRTANDVDIDLLQNASVAVTLSDVAEDRLLGPAELGVLLGVSRQRASQIAVEYDDFPPPIAELAAGRIWDRTQVEEWVARHPNRRAGRPTQQDGE